MKNIPWIAFCLLVSIPAFADCSVMARAGGQNVYDYAKKRDLKDLEKRFADAGYRLSRDGTYGIAIGQTMSIAGKNAYGEASGGQRLAFYTLRLYKAGEVIARDSANPDETDLWGKAIALLPKDCAND